MKAVRPLIHVVVALLFLAQGVAVASTRQAVPRGVAHTAAAAAMEMPCHSSPEMMQADPHGTAGKSSCCNEACPDLLSCAMSALAIPAVTGFAPVASSPAQIGFAPEFTSPAPSGAAFRPPIPRLPA
jgi:hypothetical protein